MTSLQQAWKQLRSDSKMCINFQQSSLCVNKNLLWNLLEFLMGHPVNCKCLFLPLICRQRGMQTDKYTRQKGEFIFHRSDWKLCTFVTPQNRPKRINLGGRGEKFVHYFDFWISHARFKLVIQLYSLHRLIISSVNDKDAVTAHFKLCATERMANGNSHRQKKCFVWKYAFFEKIRISKMII